MKTVYVAHPFRGDKEGNRERAKEICLELKELNPDCCFVSPLDAFRWTDDLDDEDVLEMCKELVIRCDAIYLCEGWEKSKGCQKEKMVAEMAGKDVLYG